MQQVKKFFCYEKGKDLTTAKCVEAHHAGQAAEVFVEDYEDDHDGHHEVMVAPVAKRLKFKNFLVECETTITFKAVKIEKVGK